MKARRRLERNRAARLFTVPRLRMACLATAAFSFECAAQVYRCGNTYSHAPCTGGKEIDTSPTLSWGQPQSSTVTLYLCQAYGGGQFWTREHCRQQDALVERMESVPDAMPFDHQVTLAQSRLAQRFRSTDVGPDEPSSRSAPVGRASAGQCSALDERVRQLDAMARAGGDAGYMDWIALERKNARDRQFRLRC